MALRSHMVLQQCSRRSLLLQPQPLAGKQAPRLLALHRAPRPALHRRALPPRALQQQQPSRETEEKQVVVPEVLEPQSQQTEQQQQPGGERERWQPASLLSGWKGPTSLLLSLGAVSGGGLLGKPTREGAAC